MSFKNIGGGSSLEAVVNDINQNINELKTREVTEIFKDDSGTRRVLLGKGPLGHGLFVAPEGVDVYDADASELVFNSNQNVFKIVSTGTTELDATSATAGNTITEEITHGLSHVPIVMAFVVINDVYVPLPTPGGKSVSGGVVQFNTWHSAETDATKLYIEFYPGSTSNFGTYTYRWYLLQETAN